MKNKMGKDLNKYIAGYHKVPADWLKDLREIGTLVKANNHTSDNNMDEKTLQQRDDEVRCLNAKYSWEDVAAMLFGALSVHQPDIEQMFCGKLYIVKKLAAKVDIEK